MTSLPDLHGVCPPRFNAVKDAFAANFTDAPEGLNELAARFSVTIDGEAVVDLWAGSADLAGTRPFAEDTLVPVFSTGKAVMALMIARCVDKGLLSYDDRVADHWPAFGAAGKDQLTVGQLMSHQSGLPGFDGGAEPAIWFDRQAVLDKLAAQTPMWAPGTASGYHPITIGYLAGELFRIIDGRTMGAALREDFAQPFDLDLWIGLPESEHDRVAQLRKPAAAPDLGAIDAIKKAAFLDRGSAPGGRGSTGWRMAEISSANLHGTAKDLARMMSIIATGGALDHLPVRTHPRTGPGAALRHELGRGVHSQPGPEHLRPQPRGGRPLRLGRVDGVRRSGGGRFGRLCHDAPVAPPARRSARPSVGGGALHGLVGRRL